MAKLIQLSDTSWRQPFTHRKKELPLWNTHPKVASYCGLEDGTKRLLNIKFEKKFKINETAYFQITSGKEISFPKDFQDRIRDIVFNNPDSYFTVTILDFYGTSFSSSDILWIKNVKRNQGEGWAYNHVTYDKPFLLNWPSSKKGSASTPKVGDIIVLFQKPNQINARKNYKVHFTHLVTPISTDIILDEEYPNHKWCRQVKLIAMPKPIEAIPNPGHFNFFLPNRGLTNPIINLENNLGLTEAETQDEVWSLFQNHFCPNINDQIFKPKNPVGEFGESEGDKIIREHIRQELTRRNSKIVQLAKEQALLKGKGIILCECCNFDFLKTYGKHGIGFIECHHKIFVSTGQRITTITDLALVCSNCHRMLHRKNLANEHYTVDELKKLIDDERPT